MISAFRQATVDKFERVKFHMTFSIRTSGKLLECILQISKFINESEKEIASLESKKKDFEQSYYNYNLTGTLGTVMAGLGTMFAPEYEAGEIGISVGTAVGELTEVFRQYEYR